MKTTIISKRFHSPSIATAMAVITTALILGAAPLASAASYVIVAKSQGAGSTGLDNAVARANGVITGRHEEIGVAFADSIDPGFVSKLATVPGIQSVTQDVEIQWINPMVAEGDAVAEGETLR